MNKAVDDAFAAYPEEARRQLLRLREMIMKVAAETEGVGELEESLKWGQISFLTPETKSGTTVRIDVDKEHTDKVMLFVHCQTGLIDSFREKYVGILKFEGTRGVRFELSDSRAVKAVEDFVRAALRYHVDKGGR